MRIVWTKHGGKPPTVTCYRDDGSTTYSSGGNQGAYFVFHDLVHYAVETTLEYEHAFWAMIAGGRNLDDFGTQGGQADMRGYHPEAIYAEVLVDLASHVIRGEILLEGPSLNAMLAEECPKHQLPSIELTQAQWNAIILKSQELHAKFRDLPENEKFELRFP